MTDCDSSFRAAMLDELFADTAEPVLELWTAARRWKRREAAGSRKAAVRWGAVLSWAERLHAVLEPWRAIGFGVEDLQCGHSGDERELWAAALAAWDLTETGGSEGQIEAALGRLKAAARRV